VFCCPLRVPVANLLVFRALTRSASRPLFAVLHRHLFSIAAREEVPESPRCPFSDFSPALPACPFRYALHRLRGWDFRRKRVSLLITVFTTFGQTINPSAVVDGQSSSDETLRYLPLPQRLVSRSTMIDGRPHRLLSGTTLPQDLLSSLSFAVSPRTKRSFSGTGTLTPSASILTEQSPFSIHELLMIFNISCVRPPAH
jgi:hypothetical protein